MELDFKSFKALSSPTRIKILNQVLDKEATPTQISDQVGKTKSTVSSHLSKLENAGLLEKDEEDGRKRVTYRPTRKAEAIVKGKERKVKFSLASSAITGLSAIGLGFYSFTQRMSFSSLSQSSDNEIQSYAAESADTALKAQDTASTSGELISFSPEIFLYLAIFFFGISLISGIYGILMRKIER